MTAIMKFDQGVLPAGIDNRSREDIAAGAAVDITNVSPGSVNTLELLWKPPEDDTAVITGATPNWQIVPKTGTWGTYRFRLTVDGDVSEHTFDVVSPVFGLPELAPNEKADPTASLIKNTSTEIDKSETNAAFLIFTSGAAWGWWYKIRRWLRKMDDLFHGTTGHTHDGTAGNGPTLTAGTPAHSATTGQTPDDHHAHTNKAQIDLVTDGDHDVRTDNPHAVTAAQAGAYTTAQVDALVDPTLKAPEAFAPSGTYPVTYGGNPVQKGDTFRITAAGTMGAVTVNVEDLLIALVDTPVQVDANWMVAESNRDQATETVKGVAELATQGEADAGTNDTNIMTPLKAATAPVRAHDIDPGSGPHTGSLPHASTSGKTVNDHHNQVHAIGGGDHSGTMTLAQLNAFISDATLVNKDAPNIWTRKQTFTPTEAEEAIEATGGTDKAGIKTTGGGTTGDGLQSYGAGKTVSDEGIENAEGMGAVSVGGIFGLWSEGANGGAAVVAWGIESAIGLISQGGEAIAASGDAGGDAIEAVGGQGDGAGAGGSGASLGGANGGATGPGGAGASFLGGDAIGGNADGGDGLITAGGTGNGTGQDGLGLSATPDVKIKMYSQAAEPTLLEDEAAAFWEDTDDANKIYLIFRRGAADQVKIQLT